MTDTADTLDTLWVDDTELIQRLGANVKKAREAIAMLDKNPASCFPQKQSLWGNKRYWPAVKAYFDASYRLKVGARIDAARLAPESRTPHPVAASPIPMRSPSRRSHDNSNTPENFRRARPRDETAS